MGKTIKKAEPGRALPVWIDWEMYRVD